MIIQSTRICIRYALFWWPAVAAKLYLLPSACGSCGDFGIISIIGSGYPKHRPVLPGENLTGVPHLRHRVAFVSRIETVAPRNEEQSIRLCSLARLASTCNPYAHESNWVDKFRCVVMTLSVVSVDLAKVYDGCLADLHWYLECPILIATCIAF